MCKVSLHTVLGKYTSSGRDTDSGKEYTSWGGRGRDSRDRPILGYPVGP